MKCRKKLAQTDPCCNGNDYKYKPILNGSTPVNISETDKAIDFKCGKQLQTYNTHKVTNFPTEGAWLKCSIYRLSVNGLDENVGHRIHQKMREFGYDYHILPPSYVENPPKRSPERGPQYLLGQLTSKTCNKFQNTLKSRKNREADIDVIVMPKYV